MQSTISKPVVQIPNFLSPEERNLLVKTIYKHQNAFQYLGQPATDGSGTLHLSLIEETQNSPDAQAILKACKVVSNRILDLLPEIFAQLNVEPFPVSKVPLSIFNGLDEHKAYPHTDESDGRFKISLLYYFNETPKAFKGGALELFESDENLQNGYCKDSFAKIEHEDNLFIAFRSDTYHSVTPVELSSNQFEKGRFVVVGFLGPT
jgi:Rps23 Pro-64 3,4-dihydroxylase Tpa1-like proline 4-hydroxylase